MSNCPFGGLNYHTNRWAQILSTMLPTQASQSSECSVDECIDILALEPTAHRTIPLSEFLAMISDGRVFMTETEVSLGVLSDPALVLGPGRGQRL